MNPREQMIDDGWIHERQSTSCPMAARSGHVWFITTEMDQHSPCTYMYYLIELIDQRFAALYLAAFQSNFFWHLPSHGKC